MSLKLNINNNDLKWTRPKPAYGRQGLDWIVGPGYSFVVFSLSIDFFCICSLWIARKQTFFVTNRGLHLTFMTQLEKVIIFRYKQTFFVTHGGLQLTFVTQLEKVIIFHYKQTFFVTHRGVPTDLLDVLIPCLSRGKELMTKYSLFAEI